MDQGTGDCSQGQSTPVTDTMDQGTGDCTQGQSTPVTDTMDQGTGDCTQGQSTPVTDDIIVKQEPAGPVKEEPQDEPSAVYSTVQPMSDNTSGSLLSLNTSQACQHCSAVFMLSGSLQVHMETFHGEMLHSALPVTSRLQDSASDNTVKMPSGQERLSTQVTDDSRDDSVTSSVDFVVKLEPAWSMKEEPQDEPSAVYSTVQPMSDNTSGSLLSLNSRHVCQRCFTTFVLFSSLELHLATFHGETLHDFFPMYRAYNCYDVGHRHGSKVENGGNYNNQKSVKGRKEKGKDNDADRTDQEKKSRRHACDVCSKAFAKVGDLNKHKLIHTGHRPFVCDVCSKAFNKAGNLKTHKRIHTGERPYKCSHCDADFNHSSHLQTHIRSVHEGDRPYVCGVCGKAFSQGGHLERHKRLHTGEKPHTCDLCGAAFSQVAHLERHKKMHTGEKPYLCRDCGKGFILFSDLKRHQLIHSGKKPHVCTDCGKGFTWASNLKDHRLTHTGEKPHTCPHCPAAFTLSGHLKRHVQKSHL